MPLIVRRVARSLRGAGLVQRDTTDEGVVAEDKLKRAQALVAKGLMVREAAIRMKVGKTALYKALQS